MLKLMREWGFPAGLGTLWVITMIYTLHSVSGLPMGQKRAAPPPVQVRMADPANAS